MAQLEQWSKIPNDPFREDVMRLTAELKERLVPKPAAKVEVIDLEPAGKEQGRVTLRRSERLRKKAKLG